MQTKQESVVQLDRTVVFYITCREFESLHSRQIQNGHRAVAGTGLIIQWRNPILGSNPSRSTKCYGVILR